MNQFKFKYQIITNSKIKNKIIKLKLLIVILLKLNKNILSKSNTTD